MRGRAAGRRVAYITDEPGQRRPVADHWTPDHEASRDTTRIEAFSDAVIAIMLTLLAVELLQFDAAAARRDGLAAALVGQWPSYFAFALTFLVVGQIWMTHHNLWRYIARVDQGVGVLNLLLLLSVSAIPFAAKVLAASLAGLPPGVQKLATGIYSATMLAQAIAFNLILWWARRRDLLERVDDRLFRAIARRYLGGPAIHTGALVLAFVSPRLSLACYLGVVALYLWPGAGDLPAGRARAPTAG